MAFKFVILAACLVLGSTGYPSGSSSSSRSQDNFGNYNFKYEISPPTGGSNGRQESGNAAGVTGSYNVADPDGRSRRVDYTADANGYRATVTTNEQGTASSNPADAKINSPHQGPVAPLPSWASASSVSIPSAPTGMVSVPGFMGSLVPGPLGAVSYSTSIQHVPGPLSGLAPWSPSPVASSASSSSPDAPWSSRPVNPITAAAQAKASIAAAIHAQAQAAAQNALNAQAKAHAAADAIAQAQAQATLARQAQANVAQAAAYQAQEVQAQAAAVAKSQALAHAVAQAYYAKYNW